MKNEMITRRAKTQDTELKLEEAIKPANYENFARECFENWGLTWQHDLGRALECLISAGKHRSELEDVSDAIVWLSRAISRPVWNKDFEKAIEESQLDDDVILALEYILCAANVHNVVQYIDSAMSCLKNRFVHLNRQEKDRLTIEKIKSQDLANRITPFDINWS
jgi:hypothetical protein